MDTEAFFDEPSSRPARGKKAQAREQRNAVKEERNKRRNPSPLVPKNASQQIYLEELRESTQVFAIGGAGTGKTYIAARYAVRQLVNKQVERVIITRPTVSQPRHRLGFLPGDAKAKMGPWLVPIIAAMKAEINAQTVETMLKNGEIEYVPFEHMRGRTFDNAVVLLDEAQNCSVHDLKLFLTRLGEKTLTIVSGDTDQVDIPDSGLETIINMIYDYDLSPAVVEFGPGDVVRSPEAKEWVGAFAKLKKDQEAQNAVRH